MLGFSSIGESALGSIAGGIVASNVTESATGFTSTQFGTPTVPGNVASGLAPALQFGTASATIVNPASAIAPATNFGTPTGAAVNPASGFTGTAFGTPNIIYRAVGFSSTLLPTPAGTQASVADGFRSTTFGTPAHPSSQVLDATGFAADLRVPTPLALRYTATVGVGLTAQAFGFTSSALGLPAAGWARTAVASGFASTQAGTPSATLPNTATGFVPVNFGTPQVNFTTRAAGFATAVLGTPFVGTRQSASSAYRATRFGLPEGSKTNTLYIRGIYCGGRIGHPTGFTRINRTTSGFCSTLLGGPAAIDRHRASPRSPGTRFGRALLRRGTTC